jgi:hypothetical protein
LLALRDSLAYGLLPHSQAVAAMAARIAVLPMSARPAVLPVVRTM